MAGSIERLAWLTAGAAAGMLAGLTAAAAQDTIKLGAPLPLTGALADAGAKTKQGYEACVAAVNAKGGVDVGGKKMKLELAEYDYQSDTNRAVQLVQRLVTVDKVPFLLAPYGSGDTKATAVVAERYGIPMMASAAATVSIFDQNMSNLFGVLFPNKMITDKEAAYYRQAVPEAKTVAVLALNSLFPKAIAAELVISAKANGFEVVSDGLYSPNTTDFANVLTQIKALKPDWIYLTGYTQDLILLTRQMADQGVGAKIISMTAGPAYPEFEDNVKGMSENITTNSWWHQNSNYKDSYLFGSSIEYNKLFEDKYKRSATYLEASATAACQTLAMAIEGAKSIDAEKVRAELKSRTYETFYGPVRYGKSGQNDFNAALIMQIQKKQLVVLAPDKLAQGKLVVGVTPKN